MKTDIIEGNWKQLMGEIKIKWAKLTDHHLAEVEGHREKLSGLIQEHYGLARAEADQQLADWEGMLRKATEKEKK
jgi:uncharacterized protein YjbJ (UPF0337 family)